MYTYNWITLLYTWNWHIVNQLYSNIKLKVKKQNQKPELFCSICHEILLLSPPPCYQYLWFSLPQNLTCWSFSIKPITLLCITTSVIILGVFNIHLLKYISSSKMEPLLPAWVAASANWSLGNFHVLEKLRLMRNSVYPVNESPNAKPTLGSILNFLVPSHPKQGCLRGPSQSDSFYFSLLRSLFFTL